MRLKPFDQRLDAFLDQYCECFLFSGIVRVTSRGQTVYERCIGYADREKLAKVTPDTQFCFYSLSKPFCAIGLLLLAEKGLVDLEAHPGRYVPQACGFDKRITIRSMLHHASGMPDFNQLDDSLFAEDPRELIARMRSVPANFAPYENTRYSNIHFLLFALMIENITGMPYAQYLSCKVLEPLGMHTAQVDDGGPVSQSLARGYEMNNGQLIPVERARRGMLGAGDLLGTADDVYCLNQAIKNRKLLLPETWKQVLTPSPISAFGYGCSVTTWHGKRRITHNGGHTGFRTLHIQLPQEDFDIILLSNCGFGNSRVTISEAVYDAWFGLDVPAGEQNDMDTGYIRNASAAAFPDWKAQRYLLNPMEEAALLGVYEDLTLEKAGNDYCIVLGSGQRLPCYPVSPSLLKSTCIDEQYPVTTANDGALCLLGRTKQNKPQSKTGKKEQR